VKVVLLDANVLIALAWPEHEAHERVGHWFARRSGAGWATCPFTQSAFVRILCNPAFSRDALTPRNALVLLETNLKLPNHHFWAARITLSEAMKNVERRLTGHGQVTDAYLLGLAIHRTGRLATLDKGIAAWGHEEAVEVI
jgi:toxin-antitoxin system PIN domain toxin